MSIKNFRSVYNRKERAESYDQLSSAEHELHDSLTPMSVGEQVSRFIQSGEAYATTRRRELASLRGINIDDPDDYASPLDAEHVDPLDVKRATEKLKNAYKKKNEKNVDTSKTSEESGSKSGNLPVDKSTPIEREGTDSPIAKSE